MKELNRTQSQLEYDRLAPDYDRRWRPYIDATLRLVVDALSLRGDERVLDVPCGTGELEQRLLARYPLLSMVGVDISAGMLTRAASKNRPAHCELIHSDVCHLPFADESFDYVICANSFHYFPDPTVALNEMKRVLRPAGSLLLLDWCDDFLACKLFSLWLHWTDPAFVQTYSLRSCRLLLEACGWQVADAERVRVQWIWGLMRIVGRCVSAT